MIDEAAEKAQAEREKIIASGHAEIESERNRATEELRKQVSALAVAGAEKILSKEVDEKTHQDMLKALAEQL